MFVELWKDFLKREEENLKRMHEHWRRSCKNAFETLSEELEDDYLENPCADNEDLLWDVTTFLRDYDELEDETIKWMVLEYKLFWRKYGIKFY